jgi:hypothetical protein
MAIDEEPIPTGRERRAAAALRQALEETSAEWPIRVDAAAWVATTPRRRSVVARLPIGLAAALTVVLLGVVAISARPAATGPSASPASPTSRPGHFDNVTFSFDYPASWRTLSGSYYEGLANTVDIVIGTGDWQTGCRSWSSGAFSGQDCTGDKVDVSGGRVVVKVYQRTGGPAPECLGPSANATLGSNSVLATTTGSVKTWQIREPGGQFDWPNNVIIEAHTDGPAGVASAEAIVASFRWTPGTSSPDYCAPVDTPPPSPLPKLAHYDADNISFDYPAGWPIITGYQHWGIHGPTIEFAVGTGTADAGCTLTPPSSTVLSGVACSGSPTISATGDQVVVVWYEGAALGVAPLPARTLAPGERRVTIGGMPAIESHGDGWIKWQVSYAGYIEARWGSNASAGESQVQALVASLRIAQPAKESQTS